MNRLIILIIFLSILGCNKDTRSEYRLGCEDGIRAFVDEVLGAGIEESLTQKACLNIENNRDNKK